MKILAIFVFFLLILGLGGFTWLALSDVPVEQKEVVKEISYDSISNTP
jgi:hypothetical protein